MRAIADCRFPISALALFATGFLVYGCSSPYEVRLSDERSASAGPLYFFGWSNPPLIPGTRLIDARPGSRIVLWNHDMGLEAIVDLGEECPVIVRVDDDVRAPTDRELQAIRIVFPDWTLVPSNRIADYAKESRLERRFWSDYLRHLDGLDPAAAAEFALGESPEGWLQTGGREWALCRIAARAPLSAIPKIVERTKVMNSGDRTLVLNAVIERRDLTPAHLTLIAAGAPLSAARHPAADESVCLAAIDAVAREPLSSERRQGLEAILESPGVTAKVRERVLAVPLAYPEDRDALREKAGVK